MTPKHRVLVISLSPIARDPRVMRQVQLLESRVSLTVAGFGPPPVVDMDFVDLHREPRRWSAKLLGGTRLLLGMSESYYWSRPEITSGLAALNGRDFDLVLVNDIAALPLGLRASRGSPVLVDAHEYSPGEFADRLMWRLLFGRHYRALCNRYLPESDAMITVCDGIAGEYRRNFGVNPIVIENAPPWQDLSPSKTRPDRIRMIHHGGASRARRLDLMIDMMSKLDDRFSLDFMLVPGDGEYLQQLRDKARHDPRISFVSPVGMPEICRRINEYDIGVYLLPPSNINHRFALPNKLFEFIQARLGVAIGPSQEMARVVRERGVGVVADSFEPDALADSLSRLTFEDLVHFKRASHRAADQLCFEALSSRLLAVIDELLASSTAMQTSK